MLSARRMLIAAGPDYAAAFTHDGAEVEVEQSSAEYRPCNFLAEILSAAWQTNQEQPFVRFYSECSCRWSECGCRLVQQLPEMGVSTQVVSRLRVAVR